MAATPKRDHQIIPKHIIALSHLIERPMNALEALNLYGDTCLNSTISDLTHKHGYLFQRRMEPHQNRAGGLSHFTRYWLVENQKERAYRHIEPYFNALNPV